MRSCKFCKADVAPKDLHVCNPKKPREEIITLVSAIVESCGDVEFLVEEVFEQLHRYKVKLTDSEIRGLCDLYFNKNKTPAQLEESNQLYMELDHCNNAIII